MKPVRKAIIPAAGLGTRFLPITKSIPKEMLPIAAKPIILHLAEEAIAAGIEQLILITPPNGKESINEFFQPISPLLRETLERTGRIDLVKSIEKIADSIEIISTVQEKPLGLGHAIFCGEHIVKDEPFAVILGDELSFTPKGETTALNSLLETFSSTGTSTVSVMEVSDSDVSKYGIIASSQLDADPIPVSDVIEKPTLAEAPSRLALPGRYVFSAKLFSLLAETKPGRGGEIQLSDAMDQLAKLGELYAKKNRCKRYDAGDKFGYIKANIEYGLRDPELGPILRNYLSEANFDAIKEIEK